MVKRRLVDHSSLGPLDHGFPLVILNLDLHRSISGLRFKKGQPKSDRQSLNVDLRQYADSRPDPKVADRGSCISLQTNAGLLMQAG